MRHNISFPVTGPTKLNGLCCLSCSMMHQHLRYETQIVQDSLFTISHTYTAWKLLWVCHLVLATPLMHWQENTKNKHIWLWGGVVWFVDLLTAWCLLCLLPSLCQVLQMCPWFMTAGLGLDWASGWVLIWYYGGIEYLFCPFTDSFLNNDESDNWFITGLLSHTPPN